MKKVIIVLLLICLGLASYSGYEFFNMMKAKSNYEEKINTYNEMINNSNSNKEKIIELQNELEEIIKNNSDNNKEYKIWTSLIDQVKNLLQD